MMLKKKCLILSAIAFALLSAASFSQSFTFVAPDTVLAAPPGSEIVFNTTITNTSTGTLTLAILRTLNDLPQGWESSLCFDACFPSTIDSIATVPAFGSSPLSPGVSRLFSLHVFATGSQGTGTVRILVKNTRNSADQLTHTFRASTIPSSVSPDNELSNTFALFQNFPNPFNPTTEIRFQTSQTEYVTLNVVDVLGREVASLVDEMKSPGNYFVRFDAGNLPSGVYYDVLRSGDRSATRKLILVR